MKKVIFSLIILGFIMAILSQVGVSALCLQSTNNFASEVLLNKPGIDFKLDSLSNAKNVIINQNRYVLQSEYNPNLAVILERDSNSLSLRLQIPVKAVQTNLQHVKFSSRMLNGKLNVSNGAYNGWTITCLEGDPIQECEFVKGKTNILISLISLENYEFTLESYEELGNCNACDGICILNVNKCIDRTIKQDIDDLLKYSGFSSSVNELLTSYRVLGSGKVSINELTPEFNGQIDWQSAMKQELTRLRRENILLITNQEIDDISLLSKEGNAGQNNRIVYGEDKQGSEKWLYYYETKLPSLTNLESCEEFTTSLVPTGAITFSQGQISTLYLVPIVITFFFIVLLVILIITARFITVEKRKHKLKPIIGLNQV
jgi:hypothetical protein